MSSAETTFDAHDAATITPGGILAAAVSQLPYQSWGLSHDALVLPLSLLPSQRANKGWVFDKINYHGLFTLSSVHLGEAEPTMPSASIQPYNTEQGGDVWIWNLVFYWMEWAVILRYWTISCNVSVCLKLDCFWKCVLEWRRFRMNNNMY